MSSFIDEDERRDLYEVLGITKEDIEQKGESIIKKVFNFHHFFFKNKNIFYEIDIIKIICFFCLFLFF